MWRHAGRAVWKSSPKQEFACWVWFKWSCSNEINVSEHQPDQRARRNYYFTICQVGCFFFFCPSSPGCPSSDAGHQDQASSPRRRLSASRLSPDGLMESCFCSLGCVFQDTRTCLLIWVYPGVPPRTEASCCILALFRGDVEDYHHPDGARLPPPNPCPPPHS